VGQTDPGQTDPGRTDPGRGAAGLSARVFPTLRVTTVLRGLEHPWDVQQLPGGPLLVTERESRRILVKDASGVHALRYPNGRVWVSGETGLMSLAIDRNFRRNRTFYTCSGRTRADGSHHIAVLAWRLGERRRVAAYLRTVLGGIQITSGRHGGCRLMMSPKGALWIGTGDSAVYTNPQDLHSLNGKVLRLDPRTGDPWPTNPFVDEQNHHHQRYVVTYGHRNVQGLAMRADGTVWSVEHGTDRDDEVNRLRLGGNYGWDPGPGYDESAPMTFEGAIEARWSSGYPTIATSGAAWVRGRAWRGYAGTLAVAALKGSRVVFLTFDASGDLVGERTPRALRQFGRLRSVTRLGNGDLLVTTANGVNDRVLRVRPA
jgi:glucose/arabinose dehydrogenase